MQSLMTRLLLGGGGGFSPSALFASGEQGAWYDPSDLTTLFQDSAGTTPVTAVEQPVGLVLDKSQGLALGSELNGDPSLTNNGFWSVTDPTITVGSGKISFSSTPTANAVYKSALLTAGKFYQITITIANRTTGGISIETPSTNGLNFNTNGTFTCRVRQQSSTIIYIASVGTTTLDITSISIRELPGNHAYQSTSASRPTLRARYNLVERSEEFDNAWWTKVSTTVSANAGTAPDGTSTANLLYPTTTGTDRIVYRNGISGVSAVSYTLTVYAKASGKSFLFFGTLGGGTGPTSLMPYFDLQQGQISQVGTYFDAVAIQNIGSGWYRCSATKNAVLTSTQYPVFGVADASASATATTNGTDGILIWGAQLTPTAVFPSNTYQRIAAATDYATGAAFPPYLFFDGVDDSLLTNSVDFSATDKMTVWVGVTKSSDAAVGTVVELSAASSVNDGAFGIFAPGTAASQEYAFLLRSTNTNVRTALTYTAPITNVVTQICDIAGAATFDELQARINGVLAGTNSGSAGTGNFGNYPLYIGRRNNATLPLNGNIYSLIIRGAQSTSDQIISTEQWVAQKSGITIP